MSPLAWLAVPVVVTVAAAIAVPWWYSRKRPGLSDEQRAGVIGDALAPRPRRGHRGSRLAGTVRRSVAAEVTGPSSAQAHGPSAIPGGSRDA